MGKVKRMDFMDAFRIASTLFYIGMAILFVVQAYKSVGKLWAADIIEATTTENMDYIKLPDIYICKRGYNRYEGSKYLMNVPITSLCPQEILNDTYTAEKCFDEKLLKLDDIVHLVVDPNRQFILPTFIKPKSQNRSINQDATNWRALPFTGISYGGCFAYKRDLMMVPSYLEGLFFIALKPGAYRITLRGREDPPINLVTSRASDLFIELDETKGNTSLTVVGMKYSKYVQMNTDTHPCREENAGIKFSKCFFKFFIKNHTKCQLPWAKMVSEEEAPKCKTFEEFSAYEGNFMQAIAMSDTVITNISHCLKPCEMEFYEASLVQHAPYMETVYSSDDFFGFKEHRAYNDNVTNRLQGQHFVGFYFASDQANIKTQQLAYDIYSFFGEAGGAFGFFLGLSMVSIHDWIKNFCTKPKSK